MYLVRSSFEDKSQGFNMQEGLTFNMGSAEPKRSYSGKAETDGMGNLGL